MGVDLGIHFVDLLAVAVREPLVVFLAEFPVELRVDDLIEPVLNLDDFLAKPCQLLLAVAAFVVLRRRQRTAEPFGYLVVEAQAPEGGCVGRVHLVLASVRLPATGSSAASAVVVDEALLFFARHGVPAATADQHPPVEVVPILHVAMVAATTTKLRLNIVEHLLADERVVFSLEALSEPKEPAGVELALQDLLDL